MYKIQVIFKGLNEGFNFKHLFNNIIKGMTIQKKIMLAYTYINCEVKLHFQIKKVLFFIDHLFATKVL